MIKKIISGGQTGADRAALDVALKFGIPHGGWIPKGRKTEKGPLPEMYRLKEMPTESYKARTEKNVQESDGTLIIARGKLTGGTDYTRHMTLKHKKHLLGIEQGDLVDLRVGRHGHEEPRILGVRHIQHRLTHHVPTNGLEPFRFRRQATVTIAVDEPNGFLALELSRDGPRQWRGPGDKNANTVLAASSQLAPFL